MIPDCCPSLTSLLSPERFKALCDPNRLAVLRLLCESCAPRTVSEIAAGSPIHLSVVSRHLAQLRRAGLVEAERDGREVRYRVAAARIVTWLRQLATAIEGCCIPANQEDSHV